MRGGLKPHVVVGGDEASKVWILRPRRPWDPSDWTYDSAVVFDVNAYYGPQTTQTPMTDPLGITISTVGGIAVRNRGPYGLGAAELYVPVFEAMGIHVLTCAPRPWLSRVSCANDETVACPGAPPTSL